MKNTKRRYLICRKCKEKAYMTDWKPTPGLDPDLRRFNCSSCDNTWYQVIPLDEQGDYEE